MAASSKPPTEWRSLGGTKRQYVNTTTGEVLSRRQYRERYQLGGRSMEQLAKQNAQLTRGSQRTTTVTDSVGRSRTAHIGPMNRYKSLVEQYREEQRRVTGKKPSAKAVRESDDFKRVLHDLNLKSNRAGGRKARALEALGRREPGAGYAVGETPSFFRNRGWSNFV